MERIKIIPANEPTIWRIYMPSTFVGVNRDFGGVFPVFVNRDGDYFAPDPDVAGALCPAMLVDGKWNRHRK